MSFWKTKPLQVSSKSIVPSYILDKSSLIKKISEELQATKISLVSEVLDINVNRTTILQFINENYEYDNVPYKLQYTEELFAYFCGSEYVALGFYHKTTMVGFMVGSVKNMVARNMPNEFQTVEVNFLCLVKQLRNLHVSSFMVNVMSKECLTRFEKVNSSFYTVGKKLNTSNFSNKQYYHRPVDISKMLEAGLLASWYDVPVYRRVWADFNYNYTLKLRKTLYRIRNEYEGQDELVEKLYEYYMQNYDIFDVKSKYDISEMLKSECFQCFLTKDKWGNVCDFVSFYTLDTLSVKSKTVCTGAYFYCGFFESDDLRSKFDILELIGEYFSEHDQVHMMIIMDLFGLAPTEYMSRKYIMGSADINYYFYNLRTNVVLSQKNGLVTI